MLGHPEGGKSDHCLDEESSFSLSFNNKRERRAADVERKQFVCRRKCRTIGRRYNSLMIVNISTVDECDGSKVYSETMENVFIKVWAILLRKVILSRQNREEKSHHLTLG